MAGLAAVVSRAQGGRPLSEMLSMCERALTYTGDEPVYRWADERCAVSLVAPASDGAFSQSASEGGTRIGCFLEGEIFDYGRDCAVPAREAGSAAPAMACFHAYREKGLGVLCALNGSFNLAFRDPDANEFIVVNDRFASRPLFYWFDDEHLVCASQLRSVLQFPGLKRELDLQAVVEFFTFQRVLEDRTFDSHVRTLPPASVLCFRDGRLSLQSYWRMRYEPRAEPQEYYAEALAETLRRAVRRRTSGQRRVGILLSGGLDSRAVLAAADGGAIKAAFTLGDRANSEVRTARQVAAANGCEHIFIRLRPDHYLRLVDEAVDIGDGMYRFDHAHFLGCSDAIRDNCDVLLHGHGLDYTFRGLYLPYRRLRVAGRRLELPLLRGLSLHGLGEDILRDFPYSTGSHAVECVFQPALRDRAAELITRSIDGVLQDGGAYGDNPYNAWDHFLLHCPSKHFTFLNVLCLRHHVPERTVLCDNELFALYLTMPPELRARGRVFRKALRSLSRTLGSMANANTGLRADMPVWREWVVQKGRRLVDWFARPYDGASRRSVLRHGSWPNMAELIRQRPAMAQLIWATMHDHECVDPDIFNVPCIESAFERHMNGDADHAALLFLLVTFGRWFKRCGS